MQKRACPTNDINRRAFFCLDARPARETTAESNRETPDRKSTRLNSSHSQISYAVFCLKKKNDGIEHVRGLWGTRRLDGGPLGAAIEMLQETVRAGQWLTLDLLINLHDLRPGFFVEPLDVLLRQQPHLYEPVAGIDDGIACLLGLVDLSAVTIAIY